MGAAARAIMTTDTVAREEAAPHGAPRRGSGSPAETMTRGIAKGAGMIEPNMATMLPFLTTDASRASPARCSDRCSARVADRDATTGPRSTARARRADSGAALRERRRRKRGDARRARRAGDAAAFERGLRAGCADLVRALARDGEGRDEARAGDIRVRRTAGGRPRGAPIANSMLRQDGALRRRPELGPNVQTDRPRPREGGGEVGQDFRRRPLRRPRRAEARRRRDGEARHRRRRRPGVAPRRRSGPATPVKINAEYTT